MKTIEKYVQKLFRNIEKNEETFKMQQEMIQDGIQRFEELTSMGMGEEDAYIQVTNEIGEAAELLEEYTIRNPSLKAGAIIAAILYLASLVHFFCIAQNGSVWEAYYRLYPGALFYIAITRPICYLSSAYLIVYLLGRFSLLTAVISNRPLRLTVLTLAIVIVVAYFAVILFTIALQMEVYALLTLVVKMMSNIYIFALLGGMLYFGLKKV
jgi:hypothetical protein